MTGTIPEITFTVAEAAAKVRCNPMTIYRAISRKARRVRVGKRFLITEDALRDYLVRQPVKHPAPALSDGDRE